MLKKFILITILGVHTVNTVMAQDLKGKTFWFGVMENLFASKNIELMVVAEQDGRVTLTAAAQGFTTSYNVVKGQNFIKINNSIAYPSAGAETIDDKGLLMESTFDIKLFVLNEDVFSSDVSPIIPFHSLLKGDRYIVQSLRGSVLDGSSFLIISTEDNSNIEITPTANTLSGFSANLPFSVRLDKGESFLVKADNENDLSGSNVRALDNCGKFVVFAGSKCSPSKYNSTVCSGCDHLYSQLMPVSQFGDTFYVAPFFNQAGNYLVKITAAYNNTELYIDNILVSTLNANASFEYRPSLPALKKSCIYTSKPVQVFKYMNSNGCTLEPNGNGDPSMLMIPSKEKWVNQANFGIYNTTAVSDHYINIVGSLPVLKKLAINSQLPFTVSIDSAAMCNGMAVATIRTAQTNLNISSAIGNFYCYVYSIGKNESFAYLTGAKFFPYKDTFNLGPIVTCFDNQPIELAILSDSISVLSWIMADGNTYNNLNKISHSYANAGSYKAQVVYKAKNKDCIADTTKILITINPKVTFSGARNNILCPGEKITYLMNGNPNLTYDWGNGVFGRRRELSSIGSYTITATDTNGCLSVDSFILSDSGCFDKNLTGYNVFTPNGDGLNDFFDLKYKGYSMLIVTVFDRFGKEVFNGDAVKNELWNGNLFNDKVELSSGTYYYKLDAKVLRTGAVETKYGVITLIR